MLDVTDWGALLVEVGKIEAVPVTSGKSRYCKIKIDTRIEWRSFAPPSSSATEKFQLSPICEGSIDEISWECERQTEGRYAQMYRCRPSGALVFQLGRVRESWGSKSTT